MRLINTPSRWLGTLLAVALVAGIIVAAMVAPRSDRHGRSGDAEPSDAVRVDALDPTLAHAISFQSFGVTLAPVDTAAAPDVSAAEALQAVRTDGMRLDVQESIEPDVSLASFTNTILGQTGEPPFGPPKFVDVLVWDVRYPNAPTQLYGPVTGTTLRAPDCDRHVIVDATTAAVIEGFQDCGADAATIG